MMRSIMTTIALAALLAACNPANETLEVDAAPVDKTAELSDELKALLETSSQPASKNDVKPMMGAHRSGDPHSRLDAGQLANVAMQHLDESRVELALQTLDEALLRYPRNAMLLSLRASIYLQRGNTSLALSDLNWAIDASPHDPILLTNRAQALRQFGRDQDARRDLDGAIELDDRFIAAYFNRGSLSFQSGEFVAALEDFDTCIEIEPAVAAPWFNRASTHEAMGNREMAIADLEQFLQLQPEASWAQVAEDLLNQWRQG